MGIQFHLTRAIEKDVLVLTAGIELIVQPIAVLKKIPKTLHSDSGQGFLFLLHAIDEATIRSII
jgi:hypothetical protein